MIQQSEETTSGGSTMTGSIGAGGMATIIEILATTFPPACTMMLLQRMAMLQVQHEDEICSRE
jgi:hypothetical protein